MPTAMCRVALEVSPVDSNFLRTLADNLDKMPAKQEPKPEVDLYAPVKECAATQNLESAECTVAIEQSGLSLDEFRAKFAGKLADLAKKDEMTAAMKTCLELKASLNGKSVHELTDLVEKVNLACRKALVESHMSAGPVLVEVPLESAPLPAPPRPGSAMTRAALRHGAARRNEYR
jgi:hypothetical protein